MNKLIASAAAMLSAGSAMAGSVTFTPPIATMIETPDRMGGSGAWLIPLIIIAVIGLAISKTSPPTRIPRN